MPSILRLSDAASLALHTVALLARHPDRRFATPEIAAVLHASPHTLAKVMQRLAKAGLVTSARGPAGGFVLGRPAGDTTMKEVHEVVDGPLGAVGCLLGPGHCRADQCLLGDVGRQVEHLVREAFAQTSVAALAASMNLGEPEDAKASSHRH